MLKFPPKDTASSTAQFARASVAQRKTPWALFYTDRWIWEMAKHWAMPVIYDSMVFEWAFCIPRGVPDDQDQMLALDRILSKTQSS